MKIDQDRVIILVSSLALLLLCFVLVSCHNSDDEPVLKDEIYKLYDVRTLDIDADPALSYLPPLKAWLSKYRPVCPDLQGEIYKHSVLGFTLMKPNIQDVYSDIPWQQWVWYYVLDRNVYYFDEPLPSICTSGSFDMTVLEKGKDSTGTWILLRIIYYSN